MRTDMRTDMQPARPRARTIPRIMRPPDQAYPCAHNALACTRPPARGDFFCQIRIALKMLQKNICEGICPHTHTHILHYVQLFAHFALDHSKGNPMTKQLLKLKLRHLAFTAWDRLADLWNLALPIFLTSGLLVASVKFWWWVF